MLGQRIGRSAPHHYDHHHDAAPRNDHDLDVAHHGADHHIHNCGPDDDDNDCAGHHEHDDCAVALPLSSGP